MALNLQKLEKREENKKKADKAISETVQEDETVKGIVRYGELCNKTLWFLSGKTGVRIVRTEIDGQGETYPWTLWDRSYYPLEEIPTDRKMQAYIHTLNDTIYTTALNVFHIFTEEQL